MGNRGRYEGILRKYLEPEFGAAKIGSITHAAVQRYINSLAANPKIAPGTVRNVVAVLRTACAYGTALQPRMRQRVRHVSRFGRDTSSGISRTLT
jgi:hypothetical protein